MSTKNLYINQKHISLFGLNIKWLLFLLIVSVKLNIFIDIKRVFENEMT